MTGNVVDITERKHAEEKKQQLELHLRKSRCLETIGTLAGGIAHDLNNILTPILGYAELGMLELTEKETLHEYFNEISQSVVRAQNLVSQLLLFSKSQESTPTPVGVQDVHAEALNDHIVKPPVKVTPGKGHGCILLVDDDPALLRVVTKMITQIGFTVQAINYPLQAVELFRQNPEKFNLLITDLIMPEMTGLVLAEELHKTKSQIPVILMTGYGKDIELSMLASRYGISQFLKKPVKLTEVALAINELLTSQHQQHK